MLDQIMLDNPLLFPGHSPQAAASLPTAHGHRVGTPSGSQDPRSVANTSQPRRSGDPPGHTAPTSGIIQDLLTPPQPLAEAADRDWRRLADAMPFSNCCRCGMVGHTVTMLPGRLTCVPCWHTAYGPGVNLPASPKGGCRNPLRGPSPSAVPAPPSDRDQAPTTAGHVGPAPPHPTSFPPTETPLATAARRHRRRQVSSLHGLQSALAPPRDRSRSPTTRSSTSSSSPSSSEIRLALHHRSRFHSSTASAHRHGEERQEQGTAVPPPPQRQHPAS